jgi:hypothetical protein
MIFSPLIVIFLTVGAKVASDTEIGAMLRLNGGCQRDGNVYRKKNGWYTHV